MTKSAFTTEQPKERLWLSVCVTKDNAYIVKSQPNTGTPPARLFMPWVDANDLRFFVRYGELIKPHGIVEFAFMRMEQCSELDHDRACYKELVRSEFDTTDCVPIKYFDIEKYADALNAAQHATEKLITDAQDAA